LSPLLRRFLVLVAIVSGAGVGSIGGGICGALVLGVAARVGEISVSVVLVFALVGALAGGALGSLLARWLPPPRE
jgi:membrane protein DedA with SNARE-associated domain